VTLRRRIRRRRALNGDFTFLVDYFRCNYKTKKKEFDK
jgi:hypothetical protein